MLEGLGEPLHELREAAADIGYRGRQTRVEGELRLLDEALALGLRYDALSEDEAVVIARRKLAYLLPQIAPQPRFRPLRRGPRAQSPALLPAPRDAET